jgi:Major Facilitator Superfamily
MYGMAQRGKRNDGSSTRLWYAPPLAHGVAVGGVLVRGLCLLGLTAAGVAPILLPLAVSRMGSAADIGLVMATISLGGLLAPMWGRLADQHRLHRVLLVGGLLIAAVGVGGIAFTTSWVAWIGLALLHGLGVTGASTVANVFVVETHPEAEWDERIAWLQGFHDGGHLGGLLLAVWLSQLDVPVSLLAVASITALAAALGWVTTQTPPGPCTPKPVLRHPARQGEWARQSPQHPYHQADFHMLRRLRPALRTPFGRFLGAWLLSLTGSSAFFALYPMLMHEVFGITPALSSLACALAVGLRLFLYAPAGRWSHRVGPARVLQGALGVRLLAFVGLCSLWAAPRRRPCACWCCWG